MGPDPGDVLRVSPTCVIRLDELEWRTTGSGGPGGQHANTSDTRVEVRFDVEASPSLARGQRRLLLDRLGKVVRATASDSRSQARNRELALERLRAKLESGLHVDAPRKATKPGKAAKAARLDDKRHQARRKESRRRPLHDD
ncbi:MAG: alternative ribosome rescue aminoacyl-tRNA hydrolase ArfB [Acidimicrobiia bacterium]